MLHRFTSVKAYTLTQKSSLYHEGVTLLPTWTACSAEFDVTNVNRLGRVKSQE
jgi:hypothetical protein